MSEVEKALTDAYYWLSMYKSGATTEGLAMEKVKEAIFDQSTLNENQQIVIDLEMTDCYVEVAGWNFPEELDTENLRYLFSNVLENERALEQEEE